MNAYMTLPKNTPTPPSVRRDTTSVYYIDVPLIKATKRPTLEATTMTISIYTLGYFSFLSYSEWSRWRRRRLGSSSLIKISARHHAAYQWDPDSRSRISSKYPCWLCSLFCCLYWQLGSSSIPSLLNGKGFGRPWYTLTLCLACEGALTLQRYNDSRGGSERHRHKSDPLESAGLKRIPPAPPRYTADARAQSWARDQNSSADINLPTGTCKKLHQSS